MSNEIFPPGEPPAAAPPATDGIWKLLNEADDNKSLWNEEGWHGNGWTGWFVQLVDAVSAYDVALERFRDGLHPPASAVSPTQPEHVDEEMVPHTFVAVALLSGIELPAVSPTLKDLATRLGWGNNMAASDVFNFVCEREQMLRVAQDLLETHKSNAPTAEAAIRERIAGLKPDALSSSLSQIKSIVEHEECSDPENCTEQHPRQMCVRCRIRLLLAVVSPREEPK